MLLATKNKIFVYNNLDEKEELEKIFSNKIYKIFSNEDKEKAKKFANTEKIIGFITDEMDVFDIFCDLKTSGVNIASFEFKDKLYNIVLNDAYFLSTNKRLDYDDRKKCFRETVYKGKQENAIKDLYERIRYYSSKTKTPTRKAIKIYFENFYKLHKYHMWNGVAESFLVKTSDLITLNEICYGLEIKELLDDNLCLSIKKMTNLYDCEMSDISKIREKEIPLEIKHKLVLEVIKEF